MAEPAAGLCNAAKAALLNHGLQGQIAQPTNWQYPLELALFATSSSAGVIPSATPPNITATGQSVTGEIRGDGTTTAGAHANGYDRPQVAFTTATAADTAQASNSAAETFTASGGDWATAGTPLYVNGWVLYEADHIGAIGVFRGAFSAGRNILNGDTATVAINALLLGMTND